MTVVPVWTYLFSCVVQLCTVDRQIMIPLFWESTVWCVVAIEEKKSTCSKFSIVTAACLAWGGGGGGGKQEVTPPANCCHFPVCYLSESCETSTSENICSTFGDPNSFYGSRRNWKNKDFFPSVLNVICRSVYCSYITVDWYLQKHSRDFCFCLNNDAKNFSFF